ncbi:hypothetical protein [Candidatus Phytoplasma fraxini]|uniref:Uncharacterized protein n=1 Tax=Ash yellows phytoplasma TaxID=35780 RepID=A0ABZ2U7U4_ASHYP
MKYIYDLREILENLTGYNCFHILMSTKKNIKTNFNIEEKCFFINQKDLPKINQLLQDFKPRPFEIIILEDLKQKYSFNKIKKKLSINATFYNEAPKDDKFHGDKYLKKLYDSIEWK